MHTYRAPTVDIPKDLNLTELLHTSGEPGLPESHLIAKDNLTNRSLTIGELRQKAGRIAKGLKDYYTPADQSRWAIILPNSVEYLEVVHAILWTGSVFCPINHVLKPTEISHALSVTRPDFVIVYGQVLSNVLEAVRLTAKELEQDKISWQIPQIITVIETAQGYKHFPDDFLARRKLEIPHYPDTSRRLASIHLSSGTTGRPKGVELTHYNFVANCYQLRAHDPAQFNSNVRIVAFTPFAHIANTTFPLFLGPWVGMMHHAMPQYDLETYGQLVASNKATSFQGIPSVVLSLANSDITDRYDFSSARIINTGGPPFKKDTLRKLQSKAPWKIHQCYGMTEAAGYVAFQKLDDRPPPGAVGKFLPNIDAALRVENGTKDAPVGGPGELWLRGPNITRGYAFNEDANRDGFPQPGWYSTGDVCTISPEGIVSVVGRAKELIKYKGFQVSPAELESHLNTHPHVVESGVGATWDEDQLTELPTAYVVLKDHFKTEKERRQGLREIHSSIDELVSGYKKLRGGVWEINTLPKNPTGKVLRKQLSDTKTGLSSLGSDNVRAKL